MNSNRPKLFLMMLLEFFIWGAWLPLIFGYLPSLNFSPTEQAWTLNAFPIAAIVGMFFSNQFADRSFAAEKFLAFSHLVGGAAILGCGFVTTFWPFFTLMLVHCLLYVPTISITNSIAFSHIDDPKKNFPIVRTGGTIGWILAAIPFTFILVDWESVDAMDHQGFKDWLGAVLGSGLTGDALKAATKWTYVAAGLVRVGGIQLHPPTHAAQEGRAWNGGRACLAGGGQVAQASVHRGSLPGHLRRQLCPQLLFQLDWTIPRGTC